MEQGWNLETGSGNGDGIWSSDWLWKRGWDLEFRLDWKRGRDLELESGMGIGRPGFGVVGKLDIKKRVSTLEFEREVPVQRPGSLCWHQVVSLSISKKSGSCREAATLGSDESRESESRNDRTT